MLTLLTRYRPARIYNDISTQAAFSMNMPKADIVPHSALTMEGFKHKYQCYHGKNGLVTATKSGTTNNFCCCNQKFCCSNQTLVDRT